MAGYGDRAATILDSKKDDGAARGGAISAKSALSPPPDEEPGRAISAESAKRSGDPFVRWQDGHSRIVLLELTGGPVPEKWYAALDALDAECRAIEDARRAGDVQQPALFDAPRRYV